jgi:hypothetical protein
MRISSGRDNASRSPAARDCGEEEASGRFFEKKLRKKLLRHNP